MDSLQPIVIILPLSLTEINAHVLNPVAKWQTWRWYEKKIEMSKMTIHRAFLMPLGMATPLMTPRRVSSGSSVSVSLVERNCWWLEFEDSVGREEW